jgi:hypothetical protein
MDATSDANFLSFTLQAQNSPYLFFKPFFFGHIIPSGKQQIIIKDAGNPS